MGRDLKLKLLIRLKDYIHLIIKRTMSKIYKIEFNDCVYFGSTKQKLSRRQNEHNFRLKNNPKQKLYQEAIKQGIEKLECILICECSNEERYLKENELIKTATDKILLNSILAIEDKEKKKQYNKEYREKHREELKAKNKEYREKNSEYQRSYKRYLEKEKEYQRNLKKYREYTYCDKQKLKHKN